MKENDSCEQDNSSAAPSVNLLAKMSEEIAEKDRNKQEHLNDNHHNHLPVRHHLPHDRSENVQNEENMSDDDENNDDNGSGVGRNEMENDHGSKNDRSSTPHGNLSDERPEVNAAAVAMAALAATKNSAGGSPTLPNEFNPAAFFPQPGQMSIQAFQNAIAQFTANALANNMDNDTVVKNLAILQSALFTLQQQQFLQFQLIQHLQSQLVKKQVTKEEPSNDSSNSLVFHHNNNNNLSKRNEPQDLRKQERLEEDEEVEEEGIEDAYSKSYQMANIMAVAAAASAENRPVIHPVPEEELR